MELFEFVELKKAGGEITVSRVEAPHDAEPGEVAILEWTEYNRHTGAPIIRRRRISIDQLEDRIKDAELSIDIGNELKGKIAAKRGKKL